MDNYGLERHLFRWQHVHGKQGGFLDDPGVKLLKGSLVRFLRYTTQLLVQIQILENFDKNLFQGMHTVSL
jgi:hypothetical protein